MRMITLHGCLTLLLASCAVTDPSPTSQSKVIPIQHAPVAFHGRWDLSEPQAPAASWPGFAWETSFTGTSCKVIMTDAGNFYNVWIDGKFHKVVAGKSGAKSAINVAEGLSPGKHHLRMQRRNISFSRPTILYGFMLDNNGTLSSAPRRTAPRIEFIGDSFTLGEGNEAQVKTLSWNRTQPVTNFSKSFASLIADHYRADIMPVCRSGSGLVADFRGLRHRPFEARYQWTHMESNSKTWPGNRKPPHVIVISLGLNDYSGMRRSDGSISVHDSTLFRLAYHRFVSTIRRQNPKARIVILAPHVEWVRDQARQVVQAEKQFGHKRIDYAEFDYFPNGYVADGHPNVETHRKIARQILLQFDKLGISRELR